MGALVRLLVVAVLGFAAFGAVTAVQRLDRPPDRPERPAARVGDTAPSAEQARSGAACRVAADGYLETSPVFGHPDATYVHASYWSAEHADGNVVLAGSRFARPSGFGGYFWACAGCSRAYVEAQMAGHVERTGEGVDDPALFSRVS